MENPLKYSINYVISIKCTNCEDISFCKLKTYYDKLDNPKITDLEKLTKCLYYKKSGVKKCLQHGTY